MTARIANPVLYLTTMFTGFMAGIGFFGFLGANPAISKMSSRTFAEYWQHLDFYMGARMPVFGPLLLLVLLTSVVIHIPGWRRPVFWLLLAALLVTIVDVTVAVSTNRPINELIQSWDLVNLPGNVQEIKFKVLDAFFIRDCCMIGCFALVLLAVFIRRKTA